jgi:acetolactate decarboxylase
VTEITVNIPNSLKAALEAEAARVHGSPSSVVTGALAEYLETQVYTFFQVSTSAALVAGIYAGPVSVRGILAHGDLGFGTFANFEGDMVVLDGHAYQVRGSGRVTEPSPEACAPFAIVTRFAPQVDVGIGAVASFEDIEERCDGRREFSDVLCALRLDGRFTHVRARAVNPSTDRLPVADAANRQREFQLSDVVGTLVGLWSPGVTSTFGVPGYHFHFLSEDHQHGGHLLDCSATALRLQMEALTDFYLALPETESFLRADLNRNTSLARWVKSRSVNCPTGRAQ